MRRSAIQSLLAGAAMFALASPSAAQTTQEDQAQPVNATNAANDSAASAQSNDGGMGEIVVTATKRASTVQEVPFSINAQTQEDIQRQNATTIEDISRNVAGLTVQNLGPGQSQVSIRGVSAGQIVRDQPGVKEQVGVYLDESVISLSLFTPDFDLFDINRVETLRGPQGTLFGSGSVGGTVRYITNQPRIGRNEGQVEANLNTVAEDDIGGHIKGAINLALGPTSALRVVGYLTKYAGFADAVGPAAGKNINDGQRAGVRASLLWQPIESVKITPRIVYQKVTADGFNRQDVFNLFSNQFTTPTRTYEDGQQYLISREKFSDKTRLTDLTVSVDAGPVELTSVSSYIDRDIYVSRDASALTGSVSIDLGFPTAAISLPSNLVDTTKLKQFSQELRAATTGSGPLQLVGGLFYSHVNRKYTQLLPTPGYDAFADATFGAGTSAAVANGFALNSPYNSFLPYKIDQKALFGEASYDLGVFKLTAGGRLYDYKEQRGFRSGGLFANGDNLSQSTKSNGFSPRAIATFQPSRNLSINVQAAKGFRPGGVNDPLNLPLCNASDAAVFGPFAGAYRDETLWNYEAGVKYSKGPITLNAAAFHNSIRNLQVTLDAGSCSSRVVFNVPKAHSRGIEFEMSARPGQGLDLSIAGSLVEAEFDSTLPGTLPTSTGIRDGNRLPTVPKFQVAATAAYEHRMNDSAVLYTTLSAQHVGSRYTQPADQELNPRTFVSGLPFAGATGTGATVLNLKLPSYQLVNGNIGMRLDRGLDVSVYVNNLFDETPLLSFDRERGGRARLGYNIGQPRTIGVTVRQKFGQ